MRIVTYYTLSPLESPTSSWMTRSQRSRRRDKGLWGALYASMMQSENSLVQYMARRAMYSVLGTLGTNRVILRHQFGVPRNNCVCICLCIACEEDIHRANKIREPVQVRDGPLHVSMSQCEVRAFIEYVCIRPLCKCRTIDKEHCF